ncbi:MAG: glycosyltransferase [[Clostridium] spiroforme]|uniref:Glycosyltransferase n=1 Tax=Thomasclavelia spiroformis TaxID=29348 RepID=A0A943EQR5_9FIRM|nr:glycosyltransferase [Thomasclavelia spiroformis]MBS5588770.1 glycosyltransferase [Thomasclavelia spiroformis]
MKKKLLIMASLFYPQKKGGGPPISIKNLVDAIYDKFDIYIISKNYEINEKEPLPGINDGWNEFYFGKVYYFGYGKRTYKKVEKLIHEINPDVIYQNSFFSHDDILPVLKYSKKNKKKVIISPRGEFYPNRLREGEIKKKIYKTFLKTFGLLKNVYFHGTGEEEKKYISNFIGVNSNKIYNINNLSVIKTNYLEIKKEKGKLHLVYIARIHPTKNLLNAIKYLNNLNGEIRYDIYGPVEDVEYWQLCKKEIEKLKSNIRVNYMGYIDHDKVAEIISKYHAFYMPTTGENYGHSIVESLLIGRPIIISDTTPWSDVSNYNCGYAIEFGNEVEFKNIIEKFVLMSQQKYNIYCKNAINYINDKLNTQNSINAYIEMFNE